MRFVSCLVAVAALVLVSGSKAPAAIKAAPKPVATATQVIGPQSAKVWVAFPDGSVLPGWVTWTGSPEAIDWGTAVVQVYIDGVLTRISSWWLVATTVTTR